MGEFKHKLDIITDKMGYIDVLINNAGKFKDK